MRKSIKSNLPFRAPRSTARTLQRQATIRSQIAELRGRQPRILAAVGEKKTIDLATANYACDTTGSVTALNLVATGTDYTDRIGRKILMKSVNLIGTIVPQDTTVSANLSRVMLVYDKQPTGALPVITDILNTSNSLSQINLNNRDRFVILANHLFAGASYNNTATQAVAGSPTTEVVHLYKKLNHEVIFGTVNGNIALS